ncbi:hypothetical protein imdm_1680 [gamma proteobacterium IMCC2047]|nr:hypothetical protein imdm_1680 [gamma proteobacterium IMCC2047]
MESRFDKGFQDVVSLQPRMGDKWHRKILKNYSHQTDV